MLTSIKEESVKEVSEVAGPVTFNVVGEFSLPTLFNTFVFANPPLDIDGLANVSVVTVTIKEVIDTSAWQGYGETYTLVCAPNSVKTFKFMTLSSYNDLEITLTAVGTSVVSFVTQRIGTIESFQKPLTTQGRIFTSVDDPARPLQADFTASEAVSQLQPVTANGFIADSSNVSRYRISYGLSSSVVTIGETGYAVTEGSVANIAWSWAVGAPIFLNGTSLSTVAPVSGFYQQWGMAKTPTSILLKIGEPRII